MILIEEVPLTSRPGEYTARELASAAPAGPSPSLSSSVAASTEQTREAATAIKNRDEEARSASTPAN
jgi:hypothetical protein